MDKIWQRNNDGSYTVFEAGEGPEIRAAQARRAALLEEVVDKLSEYKMPPDWTTHNEKLDNLIARVRAEWGDG